MVHEVTDEDLFEVQHLFFIYIRDGYVVADKKNLPSLVSNACTSELPLVFIFRGSRYPVRVIVVLALAV